MNCGNVISTLLGMSPLSLLSTYLLIIIFYPCLYNCFDQVISFIYCINKNMTNLFITEARNITFHTNAK